MKNNQLFKWCFTITDPQKIYLRGDESVVGDTLGPGSILTPQHIQTLFEVCLPCSDYSFQLERGEEANRLHYQGCFILKHRLRKNQVLNKILESYEDLFVKMSEYDEKHAKQLADVYQRQTHIEPMKGTKEEAFSYSQKEESRVSGPWLRKDPNAYDGGDLPDRQDFYPYQEMVVSQLEKQIELPMANRQVNWVHDEFGNTGKSVLTKYLLWKYSEHVMIVPRANAQNMRTVIIDRGPRKLYIFDLPRTMGKEEHKEDIYSVIEDVKNGTVLSAMYGKDQQLLMRPPLVWIFSNYEPNMQSLSEDRWIIWKMNGLTKSFDSISNYQTSWFDEMQEKNEKLRSES